MKKIAAGIVLYNPNAERFTACLTKLIKQLDRIYIYDNNEISNVVINSNKIVYISEKQNKGIAYALNRIMEKAKEDGYSWVITMDQDSLIPDGMIQDFQDSIDKYDHIGLFVLKSLIKEEHISQLKKIFRWSMLIFVLPPLHVLLLMRGKDVEVLMNGCLLI